MFEKYSEPARQVVVFAEEEARRLKHNYIGTEHLLLGLLREPEGMSAESMAAQILGTVGVTLEDTRAEVARIVGRGREVSAGRAPFTPKAKKVLEELAQRGRITFGHAEVGTEHLLLALVELREGVGAKILQAQHEISWDWVFDEIRALHMPVNKRRKFRQSLEMRRTTQGGAFPAWNRQHQRSFESFMRRFEELGGPLPAQHILRHAQEQLHADAERTIVARVAAREAAKAAAKATAK